MREWLDVAFSVCVSQRWHPYNVHFGRFSSRHYLLVLTGIGRLAYNVSIPHYRNLKGNN